MNYADGSTYKGMWVDDKRTRGTFVFADATAVYTPIGEDADNFSGEQMHGKGKITWASGANYAGDWVNGKRTGHGEMVYKDKSAFSGTWQDDKKVQGKMVWPTGAVYDGTFD